MAPLCPADWTTADGRLNLPYPAPGPLAGPSGYRGTLHRRLSGPRSLIRPPAGPGGDRRARFRLFQALVRSLVPQRDQAHPRSGGAASSGLLGGRPESGERAAVQLRLGAERDRQAQVRPGLLRPAELLQALAEREVRVVGRRVDLEQLRERFARSLVLTGVVEGPPERLEDRAFARLLACARSRTIAAAWA